MQTNETNREENRSFIYPVTDTLSDNITLDQNLGTPIVIDDKSFGWY